MVDPQKGIDGFIRAIRDTIIGIVVSVVTKTIILQFTDNDILAIIGSVIVFALALIILYEKMEYWGILYLIGWILGVLVMSSIISPFEIAINIVIAFLYLYAKISKKNPILR